MSHREKIEILKEVLGDYKRTREEYLFFCKFCNHHKPKLSVNLEKNVWKCWVCEKSGRNISYIISQFAKKEQKNKWFHISSAIDFTDDFDLESIFHNNYIAEEKLELPKSFETLTGKLTPSSIGAFQYLKKRGVKKQDILWWKIGYSLSGEYSGRIIIPSFDRKGELNYFSARSFQDDFPPYRNPDCSRDIVFNELYLDKNKPLVLVEGVFDAIVAGENALPLLGSTLREDSALFRHISNSHDEVYVSLDKDAVKKQKKLIEVLLRYGKVVFEVPYPKAKDIGDITKEEFSFLKKNSKRITNESYFQSLIEGEMRL
jgi:DNA primase